MFEEGSGRLTPYGKRQLARVMPKYFDAVFGDRESGRYVESVVFEGHTNSNYGGSTDEDDAYLFNLDLSQQRAHAAMEFVLREEVGDGHKVREKLSASGFSSSRPIRKPDGSEDFQKSRRIEVRFRLKDEKMLKAMHEIFNEIEVTEAE
jgi:chemotaxis protein MotB